MVGGVLPEHPALLRFQHGALISPSFGTEIGDRRESARWQLLCARPWLRIQGRERVQFLAGGDLGMLQPAPKLPWPPMGLIPRARLLRAGHRAAAFQKGLALKHLGLNRGARWEQKVAPEKPVTAAACLNRFP